ncbi:MAG: acetyl-CoA carboxylase biotin carboxyl carrier protein [Candidatus Auribacter fodinae]|jgi:acetyl-CoA carboxylase biotin carboxyl carrier protein|uniref:Biotin carboxyl carrier protein of acetyl-CoA carboxylase n=1 Tax=Candidatus Auribacter fodinae TaxID=2093366 RepID=A0A3A4R2D6_9BACT|nr:MAG: acetyl-CoA carboxylase biotin carboxyl carrier protein [Candidatus Auribacter fodinae]
MDLREIKEVIRLMKTNDITNFELEKEGFKIVLKKEVPAIAQPIIAHHPVYAQSPILAEPQMQTAIPARTAQTKTEAEDGPDIDYVVSPMVGTFYAAPSPESPPYVNKGQDVKPDDVVCIVEAMKVFNEIKCEISGTVVDILVENGAPVEFGQRMFKIKKH